MHHPSPRNSLPLAVNIESVKRANLAFLRASVRRGRMIAFGYFFALPYGANMGLEPGSLRCIMACFLRAARYASVTFRLPIR